jgi:hypothetical protein
MQTLGILALAESAIERSSAAMKTSAQLCLDDALHCYGIGDDTSARKRAIDSLRYSVGVFSEEYAKATA